jgi:predicted nucleic acid-binding protein
MEPRPAVVVRRGSRSKPATATKAGLNTYALALQNDEHNHNAKAIFDTLLAQRTRLYTTIFCRNTSVVLRELRHPARAAAYATALYSGDANVIHPTRRDEQRALAILTQYDGKLFSLCDALSFAVMERLAITHAFTFDRNFAQYGFIML